MQVQERRDELPGRVACVTFSPPALLGRFAQELHVPGIELFGDPERAAYRAFGFGRGSVARVWLHPAVWRRYWRLVRSGQRTAWSGQDTLQLGGDVVLAPDGRVAWIYRSVGPDDRPSPDALIAAARRAAG